MGSVVASSSTSSVALRILIILLLTALASVASVAAAAAASGGGTIYKVGDDAGWIERSYTEDSLDVYYNVWSSTKKFYVGDTLLFVYDSNDWEGHNNVLQVTPTAYDACADSNPIAVYSTGHDYVTLDHPGQYYFISHYGCLHGHNMLDIYVQPRPTHDSDNNGSDFIPLAPAPTLAVSPSSSASSSPSPSPSPSPDHYDSMSGTTTTSTPPSHSSSASASSSTSLFLGMLAAAVMVIFLG